MKCAIAIAALLLSLACATPRLTITSDKIDETGPQLLWGERHYQVLTPRGAASADVSKKTMGVVGGAVAGGVIGGVTGNAALGMVVGSAAGGVGEAIRRANDKPTSPTLFILKP